MKSSFMNSFIFNNKNKNNTNQKPRKFTNLIPTSVFKSCNGEYSSYQHTQSANYYLGYIDSNNKLEKQDNTTGPIKEGNNNYSRPRRNTRKPNYL